MDFCAEYEGLGPILRIYLGKKSDAVIIYYRPRSRGDNGDLSHILEDGSWSRVMTATLLSGEI